MADRAHAQRLTRWQCPGPRQVRWIALQPVRRPVWQSGAHAMVRHHGALRVAASGFGAEDRHRGKFFNVPIIHFRNLHGWGPLDMSVYTRNIWAYAPIVKRRGDSNAF